jgi:hypothetical protein
MKGKCVSVQAMKECSGRTGLVPLILTEALMEDWPTSGSVRLTFGKETSQPKFCIQTSLYVNLIVLYLNAVTIYWPVPVAARSKAWVCGSSLVGIEGSNPAGGHGCLFLVRIVCWQVEVSATSWSLVQTSPAESGRVWGWSRSLR